MEFEIRERVFKAVKSAKTTDMHTHIYSPCFGDLLLWGIDELLTYHYLVAESMRWVDMPYNEFWKLPKQDQADIVWRALFIDHSPVSEACRGVLTTLEELGLDVSTRDLESYRRYFSEWKVEEYVDKVFEMAGLESVVMTNDPFDERERPVWLGTPKLDERFHAALRMDTLVNSWENAIPRLVEWGYEVDQTVAGKTVHEVRRFIEDWVDRIGAVYMAFSLPPTFAFPDSSARTRLIEECILPVARERKIPFAMMIGVKKLTNPALGVGGDSVAKGSIEAVEYLCANYPENRFMVTMLSRENMHELAVAARKFRNLMVFGCWWFLNNPSLIKEITEMRLELLGLSMIPQHSDSRVLDQVIYKWAHSRKVIGEVLTEKYKDLAATGWQVSDEEIRRDVADLFGGNFWRFVKG